MNKPTHLVDPLSLNLAEHFLQEYDVRDETVMELANAIQLAAESWFNDNIPPEFPRKPK